MLVIEIRPRTELRLIIYAVNIVEIFIEEQFATLAAADKRLPVVP